MTKNWRKRVTNEIIEQAKILIEDLPWSIVLPAGCGKTELIAAIAASIPRDRKPIMVLTHTNAGVDVVRKRFTKYGVTDEQARVYTLDTWAKLLDDHFPKLSTKTNTSAATNDWTAVKMRANSVARNTHIGDIIKATYSAIIVDEYQDCSELQHELVVLMKQYVPVGVLGDPLQGIFDFGEGVVTWESVRKIFPNKEVAPVPHRWLDRNPTLGKWLLEVRPNLTIGTQIDLSIDGTPVVWKPSSFDMLAEQKYCLSAVRAAGNDKQVVVLRQLPEQCYKFARALFGQFNVAEEVELKVAHSLMQAIDEHDGAKAAAATVELVRNCCTKCPFSQNLANDYKSGKAHSFRSNNKNAEAFNLLNNILLEPTAQNIRKALLIMKSACQRVFRVEAWRTVILVLGNPSSEDTAIKKLQEIRNRRRYSKHYSHAHTVSRTLLVKGQECDECIILNADGMSIRNLYVALSRGIDKVTVFSRSPILTLSSY